MALQEYIRQDDARQDSITVQTGPQTANIVVYLFTGAGMLLLSLLGLFYSVGLCLMIAAAVVISISFLVVLQLNNRWTISFIGDRMYAENSARGYAHALYDCGQLKRGQIVLKQTNAKKDRGMIQIPGTMHKYGNIHNFSSLCAYIEEHIKE